MLEEWDDDEPAIGGGSGDEAGLGGMDDNNFSLAAAKGKTKGKSYDFGYGKRVFVEDDAGDGKEGGDVKAIKKKMKRAPKITACLLVEPNGLERVRSTFNKVPFKGRGHEREDLSLLLKMYKDWGFGFAPSVPFGDLVEKIEKLSGNNLVRDNLSHLRACEEEARFRAAHPDWNAADETSGGAARRVIADSDEDSGEEAEYDDGYEEARERARSGGKNVQQFNATDVKYAPHQIHQALASKSKPAMAPNNTFTENDVNDAEAEAVANEQHWDDDDEAEFDRPAPAPLAVKVTAPTPLTDDQKERSKNNREAALAKVAARKAAAAKLAAGKAAAQEDDVLRTEAPTNAQAAVDLQLAEDGGLGADMVCREDANKAFCDLEATAVPSE